MVVLHIFAVPMSTGFIAGQASYFRLRGIELEVISSPGPRLFEFASEEGIDVHPVKISREITPLKDLVSLARIIAVVAKRRPAVVHAHTPKAGLLGMLAAFLGGARARVYTLHGVSFETATGLRRLVLRCCELISCRLAHQVFCVSKSVAVAAVAEGLCARGRAKVLACGSCNGVDAALRFNPDLVPRVMGDFVRERIGVPRDATVVGFVGRLVRDKGITDLMDAWKTLREEFHELHLVLLGPFELRDGLPLELVESMKSDRRIHLVGLDYDTPPYYAAMDVLVLPSYREGFPGVLLEASAMRLPVVACAVTGCVDAVADGETGLLVPRADPAALAGALRYYVLNRDARVRHGSAGRARAFQCFRQAAIWAEIYAEYGRILWKQNRRSS